MVKRVKATGEVVRGEDLLRRRDLSAHSRHVAHGPEVSPDGRPRRVDPAPPREERLHRKEGLVLVALLPVLGNG